MTQLIVSMVIKKVILSRTKMSGVPCRAVRQIAVKLRATDVFARRYTSGIVVTAAVCQFTCRVPQSRFDPEVVALKAVGNGAQVTLAQQFGDLAFKLIDAFVGDMPIQTLQTL